MERTLISRETNLPGYEAYEQRATQESDAKTVEAHHEHVSHRDYLMNVAFNKYLHIHKVMVNDVGAEQLIAIGHSLEHERLPVYTNAAAWAYAESGMVIGQTDASRAMTLFHTADQLWRSTIQTQKKLIETDHGTTAEIEYALPIRTALTIAYLPLMKSLVVGNVTESVRQRTFADTLALGQQARVELELAKKGGHNTAVAEYAGFMHEVNGLLAMLYLNDPRYVPVPASARADTGYYYRDQTHDITLINHHFGRIKKIIPIEIKSSASLKQRQRYKALIIRGKMHLSVDETNDPRATLDAFAAVFDHHATQIQQERITTISLTVRHMLQLYQQGMDEMTIALRSVTHFHDSVKLVKQYPELSRTESDKERRRRA